MLPLFPPPHHRLSSLWTSGLPHTHTTPSPTRHIRTQTQLGLTRGWCAGARAPGRAGTDRAGAAVWGEVCLCSARRTERRTQSGADSPGQAVGLGVGKSGSTGEGKSGLDSFSSYMGDGKRQARRREGRRDWDRQAETETDRPELHRWWPGTRQPWSEGRTDRQRLGQRQTDLSCTGGGQAPGRPDLKEELKRGPGQEDGHTDPGCTGHGQRQAGRVGGRWDRGRETEAAGGGREDARAGPMSLGLGPGLKRETETEPGTARNTEAGMVRLGRTRTRARSLGRTREKEEPGAAGLVEAGMGPSVADADARQPRVGGRRERDLESDRGTERDLDTETESERGSSPYTSTGTTGAEDADLRRRLPGDPNDEATPLVGNPGWDSGPRFVPMRQRR